MSRFINCLVLVAALVSITVFCELCFRGLIYLKHGSVIFRPVTKTLDAKLGWRMKENVSFDLNCSDASGKPYELRFSTKIFGFRKYPLRRENRRSILFIGDSFTEAVDVSDSKTYYSLVGNKLQTDIFAYGCGGYGSLQEYMILDEYVDSISPNIVVWQFCDNDFIDNYYPLALQRDNKLGGPFLNDDGTIFHPLSNNDFGLRSFVHNYLLLGRWLFDQAYRIELYIGLENNIEQIIAKEGLSQEGFRSSIQITRNIMSMVRKRIPRTRIVAFSADDKNPYYDQFREIALEQGIEFIDGIGSAIRNVEERGVVVRARDKTHWNEAGHSICADLITPTT